MPDENSLLNVTPEGECGVVIGVLGMEPIK